MNIPKFCMHCGVALADQNRQKERSSTCKACTSSVKYSWMKDPTNAEYRKAVNNRAVNRRLIQKYDDMLSSGALTDPLDVRVVLAKKMLAEIAIERAERTVAQDPKPRRCHNKAATVEAIVNPMRRERKAEPAPKPVPKAKPPASKATGLSCPPVSRYGTPLTDAETAYIKAGGTITRRFGVMGS